MNRFSQINHLFLQLKHNLDENISVCGLSNEEDSLSTKKDNLLYVISNYLIQKASLLVENKKLGEICVVEMCYVFMGVKAKNLSLIFLALKKNN